MRRSTIVLVIVFLLVAGVFWYMQQPGNGIKAAISTSTPTPSGSTDVLIPLTKSPINGVVITNASGKNLQIFKKDSQWALDDGQNKPADQTDAESAVGHTLNLTILQKFDTAPDVAGTGLDKPAYTISVTLGDNSVYSFKVGNATVTGSGYYVLVPENKVYILSKSEMDNLLNYLVAPPYFKTPTPAPTDTVTLVPATTVSTNTPIASSTPTLATGTAGPTSTSGPIINLTVPPTSTP